MSKADRFEMMRLFVRIAETRSMSGAGRSLGLSQPSTSRLLKQLEETLGVHLVKRSTHALTLTDAGESFLPQAAEMLRQWEAAAETTKLGRDAHRGPIRVAAPVALGQTILAEMAARFLEQHPGVTIDWRLVDDPGDLVAGGYDLWIRAGPIQDEALIVHELGRSAHVVVGPASQPRAAHPDELAGRDAVHLAHLTTRQVPLQTEDGRTAILRLKPIFTTDSLYAAFSAIRTGIGYGVLPRWLVSAELTKQSLALLCPEWHPAEIVLAVAYPQARYRPVRVKSFIDHIRSSARQPEMRARLDTVTL